MDISDAISDANRILYGCTNDLNNDDGDSGSKLDLNNSVFTPQRLYNTGDISCTEANMATGVNNGFDNSKFDTLMSTMLDIKKNQEGMKKMFESKLDKFRTDLLENIDTRVTSLRNEIAIDVQTQSNRIDHVLSTIQSLQERMDTMERPQRQDTPGQANDNMDTAYYRSRSHSDDSDISVIANGIPVDNGED